MHKTIKFALLGLSGLGLAACESGSTMESKPAAATESQAATPSAAESACMAAVSNETNNGDVMMLSSEFSEAGTLVMVGVGGVRAPWRCLSANDGTVEEVSFAGSEGNL